MRPITRIFGRASLAAVVATMALAGTALASPAWRFNGSELTGSETAVGAATESGMTMAGLTTTCQHFLYNMQISNSGGTGQGEITQLPLYECATNTSVCTVESITAEELPWATHLTAVAGGDYLVIEKVHVNVLYGGEQCALDGTLVPVTGSAGGSIDNATESATFDEASFAATGTELKVGSEPVEWTGVFPTEAFEWHRDQPLEVS